jgi:hypothetical protein
MTDEEMLQMVQMISTLNEHQRKEIAILILSTTLFPPNVEQIAGYMVGLNERKQEQNT